MMATSSLLEKEKLKTKGESIMICLDTSEWMESKKLPMFQEQAEAIEFYCKHKFEAHPDTVVGVCGMAGLALDGYLIRHTNSIELIMKAINAARIGGCLRLPVAISNAHFSWFGRYDTVLQKRVVIFAGGPVYDFGDDAIELGKFLRDSKIACDAISFGFQFPGKRKLFDILIDNADNKNGNCNVCHVPPESSVVDALSRSQIIIPRVAGGSFSPPPPPSQKPIQICVKAAPTNAANNTDCPFCQRVLLTLTEKELIYDTHTINLDNRPDWFVAANPDGILPLIKFDDDDKWYSNSDVIVEMIENKYPRTPLAGRRHLFYLGVKILPKLLAFLKNEIGGTDRALLVELMELEEHLSTHKGPYVNGENITDIDLSLAPKLYHFQVAWKHIKQQDIPTKYTKVLDYTKLLFDCESFKKTQPLRDDIIAGWDQKLKVA